MASDYSEWLKIAKELGLENNERKVWIHERQAEAREERAKANQERKLALEQEERKLALEREEKAQALAREREERKLAREREERAQALEREDKIRQDNLRLQELTNVQRAEEIAAEERKQAAIERQRAEEMAAAERQRSEQLAAEERRQEREVEMKRLEIERDKVIRLRELELQSRQQTVELAPNDDGGDGNNRTTNDMRHRLENSGKDLRLPVYDPDVDSLDTYLLRFERMCVAYNVSADLWAINLSRFLKGEALQVYERIDITKAKDYDYLKEQLLLRYKLTEDGYRKKFKTSQIQTGETISQFVDRLRRYFMQWIDLSGYERSYDGIEELILRDQLFGRLSEDIRIHIKQKGKMPLDDMVNEAQNYLDAREMSGPEAMMMTQIKRDKQKTFKIGFKYHNQQGANGKHVKVNKFSDKSNSHNGSGFKNPWNFKTGQKVNQGRSEQDKGCGICGIRGHTAKQCYRNENRNNKPQTVASLNCTSEESRVETQNETVQQNANIAFCAVRPDSNFIGEVKTNTNSEFERLATVNGIGAKCLFDSGCSTVVIAQKLVNPSQLTGRYVNCTMANGYTQPYPTALVNLDSEIFKGEIEAVVMKKPINEIIFGLNRKDDYSGNNLIDIKELRKLSSNDKLGQSKNRDESANEMAPETKIGQVDALGDQKTDDNNSNDVGVELKTEIAACDTRSDKTTKECKLKLNILPKFDISKEEFKQLQKQDLTIKKCWDAVEKQTEKQGKGQFVVKNEMLYRRYREGVYIAETLQLVVPQGLREKVMTLGHEALLSAHLGITKTYNKINREFFWPAMKADIKRHVLSCHLCQMSLGKQGVSRAPLGHLPIVNVPGRMISVDIVGPIEPRSSRGNRYILTIICQSTRFADAIALKGISAEEVADALFEYYCRMGIPERIHTDRGSQFTSELMAQINKILLITHTMSSPYHAEGNSCVERFNGSLKATLKKLIVEQPKQWDRFLAPLLFALRDSVHESHGFTPFELMYGRSPRGLMKILKELWTKEEVEDEVQSAYTYVLNLREKIEETCLLAQKQIELSQKRNEKYYNRKTRYRELKIGDKVLLLIPVKANKMSLKWQGPYVVIEKIGDCDYRIEVAPNKIRTYHINMMKKYNERGALPSNENNEDNVIIASVVTVVKDGDIEDEEELLELYSNIQKGTYRNVIVNPNLSEDIKKKIDCLLMEYKDIFSDVPGRTNLVEHEIKVTQEEPVRQRAYPTPYGLQKDIDKEIDEMLKAGIIERTDSPYAAPLVVVKKADGSNRLCCNYKQLNKITIFDPEPMTTTEEIFNKLSGSTIFSKFDFCKGYYQIGMKESSKDKTAFICSKGLFRFNVLPFGLINSAQSYLKLMRKVLDGLQNLESYVDDVLAHTNSWDEHLLRLREFFCRVRQANLTLKPKKCQIGYGSIDFLGHTLDGIKIKPREESVDKIKSMPKMRTKKQVRSFLGAVNYYRKFIPDCAEVMRPLTELTRKRSSNVVEWNDELNEAFEKLKEYLSKSPVLKLPDLRESFIVRTDASGKSIGGVLLQEVNGVDHPVAYVSRKLNDREARYAVEERECLAIVWCIQKFHRYLYGTEFTIETDHCSLQYLKTGSIKNARVMRWYLALQDYNFKVKYIKGITNVMADYLSRGIN
jgi:transposase InsO family protein